MFDARFIGGPLNGMKRVLKNSYDSPPTFVNVRLQRRESVSSKEGVTAQVHDEFEILTYELYDNWPVRYRLMIPAPE